MCQEFLCCSMILSSHFLSWLTMTLTWVTVIGRDSNDGTLI